MNREDYIGRTFLGFEFEEQRRDDGVLLFSYNELGMKRFVGKELEIKSYRKSIDSFIIMHNGIKWHYPASMVIEQLSNISEEDILKKLNKLFKQIKK